MHADPPGMQVRAPRSPQLTLIAACLLILIGMSVLPGCEGQDPTSPAAPPETASGVPQTSPDALSLMQQLAGR